MLFQNPVINTEELPAVESVQFQRLSPAWRVVSYISTLIFFVFLSMGWGLFYVLAGDIPEWISMGSLAAILVLFLLSMVLVSSRYRMAGYALRAYDIMYKRGVFWHSTTIIPYSRIQHVEISQGPVQSAFGIATLRIYTAGGSRSDLSIEGLERKSAEEIKELITGKVAAAKGAESEQDVAALRSEEEKAEGTDELPTA